MQRPTANPYLVVAAVTAAACLGIRDKAELPAPLEGYGYDPKSAPMLPQTLPAALDALAADTAFARDRAPVPLCRRPSSLGCGSRASRASR